jgi:hypothetical protein
MSSLLEGLLSFSRKYAHKQALVQRAMIVSKRALEGC